MMTLLVMLNALIGSLLLVGGEPLRAMFSLLVSLFILVLHWEDLG